MRSNNILILPENIRINSHGSSVLLRRQLQKAEGQELNRWLVFRDKFLEENRTEDGKLMCSYCGREDLVKEIENMRSTKQRAILATIDHIVPLSKGGPKYDKNNCTIACSPCNEKKGNVRLRLKYIKQ